MWHVDSADGGQRWTAPKPVTFEGFGPEAVNWAQVARVSPDEPKAKPAG